MTFPNPSNFLCQNENFHMYNFKKGVFHSRPNYALSNSFFAHYCIILILKLNFVQKCTVEDL